MRTSIIYEKQNQREQKENRNRCEILWWFGGAEMRRNYIDEEDLKQLKYIFIGGLILLIVALAFLGYMYLK